MLHRLSGTSPLVPRGLFFIAMCAAAVEAQPVAAVPPGVFAEIDTRRMEETIHVLQRGDREEKATAIEAIRSSPDTVAPPVLYLLSNVLFERGERDEAAFWFYAGQLRARFDANRCADRSAREAVSVLNEEYGPLINQYTFKDIPKLEALIPRVVEWDKQTPHNYDHRWINLHGMEAILAANQPPRPDPVLSLPADQWEEIAEKTRLDYLAGFHQALAQIKSMPK